MIQAKVIADSKNKFGNRITTLEVIMPRIVLAEFNTHRMFSRNSASSRAIPLKKMVETIKNNPFIPIAWQKDHKGMQGTKYVELQAVKDYRIKQWLNARDKAIESAESLHTQLEWQNNTKQPDGEPITKQLCNRLLEPFMYHKVLVTATEWENFFKLRCPSYNVGKKLPKFRSQRDAMNYCQDLQDNEQTANLTYHYTGLDWLRFNESQAEIHIQAAAEAIWDAMNESIPKQLKEDEWHIPYGDDIEDIKVLPIIDNYNTLEENQEEELIKTKRKIAIARCARVSYTTLDTNAKHDYEKDLKLYDVLASNGHASPFEHVAKCMNDDEYDTFISGEIMLDNHYSIMNDDLEWNKLSGWCKNFKGFIQERYYLEQNSIK